jgi:RNA polymerase-binding transcription factor DksA
VDEETVETLKALQSSFDEIEEAQERIRGGTYGCCTDCLRAIPRRRLEVLPSAIRCGDCQRKHEAWEIFQHRPRPQKPNRRSRVARSTNHG